MLNQKLTGQQAADKTYIEDVFSTYLYTGNGSTKTITNGIDLAGKGGMVWLKNRDGTYGHNLLDTARGANNTLSTNTSNQQYNTPSINWSFNSNGFSQSNGWYDLNGSGSNYASWTFRKAPKFFDVVTYTGDGSGSQTISHSLATQPGMIMIKKTSATSNWEVFVRNSSTTYSYLNLNNTFASGGNPLQTNVASSTQVNLGWISNTLTGVNNSGATYVAYIFAHDTTTDGLIQCGSFTGATTIDLGWEPQYLLLKNASSGGDWYILDTMRGWTVNNYNYLFANTSNAESFVDTPYIAPTSTGFKTISPISGDWVYMAIRRPMKVPTDGTEVFKPYSTDSVSNSGSNTTSLFNAGFVVDMLLQKAKDGADGWYTGQRITANKYMKPETTAAEVSSPALVWDSNVGAAQYAGPTYGQYCFKRAPGFFDVVCYTGTGVVRTINHNLGVAPELMIVKSRSNSAYYWNVYVSSIGSTKALYVNQTGAAVTTANTWNNTTPTLSNFTVGTESEVNGSGDTYVAYLFASCPGVSKVGSYTGNGSSQTINCGFSAGARFVLIKRTDSTGDWYVWDTARGIVAGNDPHLSLNSTAAEVTSDDTIDPASTGFIVNQAAATNVNVSGGSYIYLAIA